MELLLTQVHTDATYETLVEMALLQTVGKEEKENVRQSINQAGTKKKRFEKVKQTKGKFKKRGPTCRKCLKIA